MTDPRGRGGLPGVVRLLSDSKRVVPDRGGQVGRELAPTGNVAACAVRVDPLVLALVGVPHGQSRLGDDVVGGVAGREREHGEGAVHPVVDQTREVRAVATGPVVPGDTHGHRGDPQLTHGVDEPVGLVLRVPCHGLVVHVGGFGVDAVASEDLGRRPPALLTTPGTHDQQVLVGLEVVESLRPARGLAHAGTNDHRFDPSERTWGDMKFRERTDHLTHVAVRLHAQLSKQRVPRAVGDRATHLGQLADQGCDDGVFEVVLGHGGVELAESPEERPLLRGAESPRRPCHGEVFAMHGTLPFGR